MRNLFALLRDLAIVGVNEIEEHLMVFSQMRRISSVHPWPDCKCIWNCFCSDP